MVIVILLIVLLIFLALLSSRSQILQRFAVMELILILAVAGGAWWGMTKAEEFTGKQYLKLFGVYLQQIDPYLEELEENAALPLDEKQEKIEEALAACLPVTTVGQKQYTYLNAALLVRDGSAYEAALFLEKEEGSLQNGKDLTQAKALADTAVASQAAVYAVSEDETGLLAITASEKIAPTQVMVVEISLLPLQKEMQQLQQDYFYGGGAILLIGTVLLLTISVLQGIELRRMISLIEKVGEGKEDLSQERLTKKQYLGSSREMRAMWNSVSQIVASVARINYEKFRMLQAYYRFAPRDVEKILNRRSILEVETKECVHTSGLMGLISFSSGMDVNRLNENYTELIRIQKEHGGIMLSGSSDLTALKLLFPGKTAEALSFGIEASAACEQLQTREEEKTFLLLHKTNFVYGVAGDEEQASTFVLSEELKALEKYAVIMREMGMRMVVTDSICELVQQEAACRYIGFIEENETRFSLYEVLDAYPARERRARLNQDQKFQEGLSLFYRNDFYLARNLFADILKECPSDEAAKWYLFTCERCLHNVRPDLISYGFLSDEQER